MARCEDAPCCGCCPSSEEVYYDYREEIDSDPWDDAMDGWGYDDEREEDRLATPDDAMREYAHNVGLDRHRAGHEAKPWILTPFDVWMKNPFYTGPAVPHPEDYQDED